MSCVFPQRRKPANNPGFTPVGFQTVDIPETPYSVPAADIAVTTLVGYFGVEHSPQVVQHALSETLVLHRNGRAMK